MLGESERKSKRTSELSKRKRADVVGVLVLVLVVVVVAAAVVILVVVVVASVVVVVVVVCCCVFFMSVPAPKCSGVWFPELFLGANDLGALGGSVCWI